MTPPIETVAAEVAAWRTRDRLLGAEVAAGWRWRLLVGLYHAQLTGREMSVSALCTVGGAPTTALRAIVDLERAGLIRREQHARDRRVRLIHLTPRATALIAECFARSRVGSTQPAICACEMVSAQLGAITAHLAALHQRIAA